MIDIVSMIDIVWLYRSVCDFVPKVSVSFHYGELEAQWHGPFSEKLNPNLPYYLYLSV